MDLRAAKAIITGRPEVDRQRTVQWLATHGFDIPALLMRNPAAYDDTYEQVAQFKACSAVKMGCTHFIESDPQQAIHIAQHAPLLRVVWWDAAAKRGRLVSAFSWVG
ncbi:hypothetical protein [Ralstonia syzygii]|uniref:hypothetical protein n=1 Tax=Ralstonia syzygii TaxID=28097 RepID=UPI001E426821|nr:hypothetical protein [Ralstonia syzygii]